MTVKGAGQCFILVSLSTSTRIENFYSRSRILYMFVLLGIIDMQVLCIADYIFRSEVLFSLTNRIHHL